MKLLLFLGFLALCSARVIDETVFNPVVKPVLDIWEKKIICNYWMKSLHYTGVAKFTPEDIDVNLCTHLLFSNAKVENGVITPVNKDDVSYLGKTGLYERLNNLKFEKPDLKTILVVGGPEQSWTELSKILTNHRLRKNFIEQTVCFLRSKNFDGINIDWVHPGVLGKLVLDKTLLTQLIVEMSKYFKEESLTTDNPKLLLTVTVPGNIEIIEKLFDMETISNVVEMVLVKTFDMLKKDLLVTMMHSPLRSPTTEIGEHVVHNQDSIIRYLILKGVVLNKLIMGLPFYGRTFTLVDPEDHNLGAPITGLGMPGKFTKHPGFLAYYEICDHILNGWTSVYHPTTKSHFAYGDDQWVGYDDIRSIKEKVDYIKEKGLGGALIMSLGLDDFTGEFCNMGPFPLLKKVNEVIGTPITYEPYLKML